MLFPMPSLVMTAATCKCEGVVADLHSGVQNKVWGTL